MCGSLVKAGSNTDCGLPLGEQAGTQIESEVVTLPERGVPHSAIRVDKGISSGHLVDRTRAPIDQALNVGDSNR